MLKIISKKKYDKKEKLLEMCARKIEEKDLKIFQLEMANENKQGLIDKQNERIKMLEKMIKEGGKNE